MKRILIVAMLLAGCGCGGGGGSARDPFWDGLTPEFEGTSCNPATQVQLCHGIWIYECRQTATGWAWAIKQECHYPTQYPDAACRDEVYGCINIVVPPSADGFACEANPTCP